MGVDVLLKVLEKGGPWGMVAILLVVIGFMWKYITKIQDARVEDSKEYTTAMESVTEKYVTATIHMRATLDNTAKAVDKLCEARIQEAQRRS